MSKISTKGMLIGSKNSIALANFYVHQLSLITYKCPAILKWCFFLTFQESSCSTKTHTELRQTSKMKFIAKIVNNLKMLC